MGVVNLTPLQSVQIFGWLKPKRVLRWTDVVDNAGITFNMLKENLLTNKQLYALQEDVAEWVLHGSVTLADTPFMKEWNMHPIRDMKADLFDVINLRWSASCLRSMGVSYAELRDAGLGPDNMHMFGFTMIGWQSLGFTHLDLRGMTDAQIARVFCMTRQATEKCFIDSGS